VEVGSWESADPRWWVSGGKIRFRFRGQGSSLGLWVAAIKPKPWGVRLLLSNTKSPVPEAFEVAWQEPSGDAVADARRLRKMVHHWLRCKFPAHRVLNTAKRPDRAKTLSGLFLRVLFRQGTKDSLLIAADESAEGEIHTAVSQALLWLSALTEKRPFKPVPIIYVLVPSGSSASLAHRCRFLNKNRIRTEVWEYSGGCAGNPEIRRAADPPAPQEDRDYRWPVLGPFRWSSRLEQVLNLAPDLIRRYPRFQDYDSLRLWGLEFAQVMGSERDRICFGVGALRTELTESNFDCLRALIEEIRFHRRPDSPDVHHPYYRLQAERWLEALILEDVARLFPEMAPESVYSQIPVYLGKDPGRVDVLGADRQGILIVMELKVTADPDLPMQALDYWGRVIRHSKNGDFERRGYFSEVRLGRQRPKIYLVSPVFSFHDSTESLLRFLTPDLDVWKISINEDWRCGVKIMQRNRYRCGDLRGLIGRGKGVEG
jgi:hypothetical protein